MWISHFFSAHRRAHQLTTVSPGSEATPCSTLIGRQTAVAPHRRLKAPDRHRLNKEQTGAHRWKNYKKSTHAIFNPHIENNPFLFSHLI